MVRAPLAETANTDTVWPAESAVASKAPEGLNATEFGARPVLNGDPSTLVRAPLAETANTDTVWPAESAVASKAPEGLNATETGRCGGRS